MSMNLCAFSGNLTRDVILREVTLTNGETAKVANFTIAVNNRNQTKNADGTVKPVFVRVTQWRGAAEAVAKWLRKGNFVEAHGAINMVQSTGPDGRVYYNLELTNATVDFTPMNAANGQQPVHTDDETPAAPIATAAPAANATVAPAVPTAPAAEQITVDEITDEMLPF